MRIKLFAAGAAIALAATIGSASAADQFSTLEGIAAEAMTAQEMGKVVGAHLSPGGNLNAPFGSDPLDLKGSSPFGNANDNGLDGILQGYVVRSPTCAGHSAFH